VVNTRLLELSLMVLLLINKGIFRTSAEGDIYEPLPGGKGRRHVTYIEVNCSATAINADLAKIASGFYS
jgi:hypothetical protein